MKGEMLVTPVDSTFGIEEDEEEAGKSVWAPMTEGLGTNDGTLRFVFTAS